VAPAPSVVGQLQYHTLRARLPGQIPSRAVTCRRSWRLLARQPGRPGGSPGVSGPTSGRAPLH